MVDRVENNITQSTNYVEKAKENTEKAVTYQQRARKVPRALPELPVLMSVLPVPEPFCLLPPM